MTLYNKEDPVVSRELVYDILQGDAKDKLFPQLQDIGRLDFGKRPTVQFRVHRRWAEVVTDPGRMRYHGEIFVCINGLEAEDGSGDSWNISGYLVNYDEDMDFESDEMNRFHGLYNTRTRKGWLRPRS